MLIKPSAVRNGWPLRVPCDFWPKKIAFSISAAWKAAQSWRDSATLVSPAIIMVARMVSEIAQVLRKI